MKTPLNDHFEWIASLLLLLFLSLSLGVIERKLSCYHHATLNFVEEKKKNYFRFNNWVWTFNTQRRKKNNLQNEIKAEKKTRKKNQQIAFAIYTMPKPYQVRDIKVVAVLSLARRQRTICAHTLYKTHAITRKSALSENWIKNE